MDMLLGGVLFFLALRFLHSLGWSPLWTLGGAICIACFVTSLLVALLSNALAMLTSSPLILILVGVVGLALVIGWWIEREGLLSRERLGPF